MRGASIPKIFTLAARGDLSLMFSLIVPHFSLVRRWQGMVDPELWRAISRYASQWFPNSGIIFADMHSALAFAMSGDSDALRSLINNPKGPAADVLRPIARGFDAFARQGWNEAVRELQPVLATHERVGGSRA